MVLTTELNKPGATGFLPVFLLTALVLTGCDSDITNHIPGIDPWLDGNPGEYTQFVAHADEGPVVMLNLLKFKTRTADGRSGQDAYAEYAELATPFVTRHGGTVLWLGETQEQLVGDTRYDWDAVLLVTWPKKQNLIDLGNDPEYHAIAHHRTDALERTMLIALKQEANLMSGP